MCAGCQHLKIKDRKDGVVSGALFYCDLKKEYVYACDQPCENFNKDANRNQEEIEKIIQSSKEYDDNPLSAEAYFTIFFILVIIYIIMNVI